MHTIRTVLYALASPNTDHSIASHELASSACALATRKLASKGATLMAWYDLTVRTLRP